MSQSSDPFNGQCRCKKHADQYTPRRKTLKFFWIAPVHLPSLLLCGPCMTQNEFTAGGLIVSEQSLKGGLVAFMTMAAVDLRDLKRHAVPLRRKS